MKAKYLLTIIFISLCSNLLFSQDTYEESSTNIIDIDYSAQNIAGAKKGFSMDNFTMGIKGGVNFSLIIPLTGNSVFSGSGSTYDKEYNPLYQNIGYQLGFVMRYSITHDIKISVQPSMNDYSFKYSNEYSWQGTTNLTYLVEHHQNMRFFEIPLIVGYYFKAQKWQPFIQAGGYYARLMNSNSYADVTETSDTQVLTHSTTVNSNGIYKENQFGILGGGGIRYAAGRTMIGFEANYRFLLSKLSSTSSLYGNNQVTGNYDITDDLLFNNIALSISITVPLVCNEKKNGPYIFCKSN
jgi:hypothetical protein